MLKNKVHVKKRKEKFKILKSTCYKNKKTYKNTCITFNVEKYNLHFI